MNATSLFGRLLKYAWLAVTSLLIAAQACHAETVKLATYYDYTPWYFPDNAERGLNAELVRRLNLMAGGRYQFESVFYPRKRLDGLLQQGTKNLVVPWVHPRFFGDLEKTRYLWTGPLLEDESLIVSSRSKPLEYDGPASLRGKRMAAPAGHQFNDFEPYIAAGEIVRIDVPQIKNALLMLVNGRNLDFTITDRSTLNALKLDPFMDHGLLHVAKTPRTPMYTRHMLVPKGDPELFAFLNQALATLWEDKNWMDFASYLRPMKICFDEQTAWPYNASLYAALLETAARYSKLKLEMQGLPWSRCQAALAAGEVVASAGVNYSATLAAMAVYPSKHGKPDLARSINLASYTLLRLKGSKVHWNGSKFMHLRSAIALQNNLSIVAELKKIGGPELLLDTAAGSAEAVMHKLLQRQVQLVVVSSEEMAEWASNNPESASRLEALPQPSLTQAYFIIFGKEYYAQNTAEIEAFWNHLALERQSEEYQAKQAQTLKKAGRQKKP